jgi:hypothetical protein
MLNLAAREIQIEYELADSMNFWPLPVLKSAMTRLPKAVNHHSSAR